MLIEVIIFIKASLTRRGSDTKPTERKARLKRVAGPLVDMGPYYLTALIPLLGPIKTVSGLTSRQFSSEDYPKLMVEC